MEICFVRGPTFWHHTGCMTIVEGCLCRQKINMEIEFTIRRKQRKESWRLIIKDSPCHHLDISWPSLSKKEGWRGDNQGLSFSDTWKLPIHHSSTTVSPPARDKVGRKVSTSSSSVRPRIGAHVLVRITQNCFRFLLYQHLHHTLWSEWDQPEGCF